jgi:phage terminase large subunit-like protein
MATLIVPKPDGKPWPTLGPDICDWIEESLVYGPGDLRGQPYVIEDEFRALLYRMYEVVPKGKPGAGRRRFNRAAINVRKGTAKTEKAAIIAACELHPDAPVRCDGFDANGDPVGRGVRDPYVAMVAFTLEQTEELGFNVLRTIISEGPLSEDFDIGLERILVLDGRGRAAGKAVPLSGAPGARDGARTTHQSFDETHRMTKPSLIKAHTTMLQNTYKRQMADAWTLETTTFHDPTELSVAADTFAYAQAVAQGDLADPRLFYFYRYAPEEMPMANRKEVKEALLEASGPAAAWSADLDGLVEHWFEPKTDQNYYRRVWLNQRVSGSGKAFDSVKWAEAADAKHVVRDGAKISIGFDGAKNRDGTALVACELSTGYMWLAGYWQAPDGDDEWEVDANLVGQVVDQLFDKYKVDRMYADPFYWTTEVDSWRGKYGDRKVISFATTSYKRTGMACQSFAQSIIAGQVMHDGDSKLAEHVGNSVRMDVNIRGDDDVPLWVITKERRGSPLKIDAAMAAVLAWQARNDAIAKGALKRGTGRAASFN